jgi:protein-disulfide isomerase
MFRKSLIAVSAALALFVAGAAHAQLAPPEERRGDMVLGKADAPVTLEIFEWILCPVCAQFHAQRLPELKAAYIDTGKVKLVIHDLPYPESGTAAVMMARCLGRERYHGMMEILYREQGKWGRLEGAAVTQALMNYGRLAGMTEAEYRECLADKQLVEGLVKRWTDGEAKYGRLSTPTMIVGGQRVSGMTPMAELAKLIDPLVEKALKDGPKKDEPKKDDPAKPDGKKS